MTSLLTSGTILHNRYRIICLLGQGGMGAVYLAEDMPQGNRWVAVKEMIPDPNANTHALAQARTQFWREAQVLMSLRHRNLPQVYESFAVGGSEYLVMQYIEGRNLPDIAVADWQQGRALGESRVLGWAMQIMDALEYLHGQRPYPVLHRDIKPQNIILTPGGELYLVDFGLVKLLDPNNPQTMTALRGMGTPEYAPAEQYASAGVHTGPYSDIYALGATLYHLLTGQPPSTATDRLLPAPMNRPLVPPRQLNPAISPHVEQALVKALELAPADRFTSVTEMRRALLGQSIPLPAPPFNVKQVAAWSAGGALIGTVLAYLPRLAIPGGTGPILETAIYAGALLFGAVGAVAGAFVARKVNLDAPDFLPRAIVTFVTALALEAAFGLVLGAFLIGGGLGPLSLFLAFLGSVGGGIAGIRLTETGTFRKIKW